MKNFIPLAFVLSLLVGCQANLLATDQSKRKITRTLNEKDFYKDKWQVESRAKECPGPGKYDHFEGHHHNDYKFHHINGDNKRSTFAIAKIKDGTKEVTVFKRLTGFYMNTTKNGLQPWPDYIALNYDVGDGPDNRYSGEYKCKSRGDRFYGEFFLHGRKHKLNIYMHEDSDKYGNKRNPVIEYVHSKGTGSLHKGFLH